MKTDNNLKIKEGIDSSVSQSKVFQTSGKNPKLSNLNHTQNRRYVNFKNGSHFICYLNLNPI